MGRILIHGDQKGEGQNRIKRHDEPKRKIGDIKEIFPFIHDNKGENDTQNE